MTSSSSPRAPFPTSHIPGFAKMTPAERSAFLAEHTPLDADSVHALTQTGGLPLEAATTFIENCVGGFTLPLGIATNFLINGKDVLVPMAVEESSVVAAASHGAKLARSCGGFTTEPTEPIATCQIEFFTATDDGVFARFEALRSELWRVAEECHPRLVARGGGVKGLELRQIANGRFVIHVHIHTCDAMGANIVNTVAETLGTHLPSLLPCTTGLRILTNLTVHRVTKAWCEVTPATLSIKNFDGKEAIARIVKAWEFAALDPFRAATHNKGVMNGIDPVAIATGNDWRAIEAASHAFASISGSYKPITRWSQTASGNLRGEIEVPLPVGTVGGVTRLHPGARAALTLLGQPSGTELSGILACVGLAQNLSALRALACEGIQQGHMALHEKNMEMLRAIENTRKKA